MDTSWLVRLSSGKPTRSNVSHSETSHICMLDTLGMDPVSFQSRGLNTLKSHTLITWTHSAWTPSASSRKGCTQSNLTLWSPGHTQHGPRQLPVARAEHSQILHFGHLDTLGMDTVSFQSQGLNTVKSHTLVAWTHLAWTPSASSRKG